MIRALASALMSVALCACSSPKGCPDEFRLSHIPYVAKDEGDHALKIDDCLRQYTGDVSKGPSSEEVIAKAAIAYCGTYDFPVAIGDPDKADLDREKGEALTYIVAQRAYQCPKPRERDLNGNLKPASWLPAFLQST